MNNSKISFSLVFKPIISLQHLDSVNRLNDKTDNLWNSLITYESNSVTEAESNNRNNSNWNPILKLRNKLRLNTMNISWGSRMLRGWKKGKRHFDFIKAIIDFHFSLFEAPFCGPLDLISTICCAHLSCPTNVLN